jgi:hypothetical protein
MANQPQGNRDAAKEAAVRQGSQALTGDGSGNDTSNTPPTISPLNANPPAAEDLTVEDADTVDQTTAATATETDTGSGGKTAEGLSKREVSLITAAIVSANEVKRTTPLPTPGMDVAPKGGQEFIVGGQVVDCNGVVIAKPSSEAAAAAKSARANRTDVTFAEEEV